MQKINHIAIVMDGNGRWAKKRFRPRVWGHVRGAHKVSKIVEFASDYGLASLTLYAFSTENWSRPQDEVLTLFRLLDKFLVKEKKKIVENNIKFNVIGEYHDLSKKTLRKIEELKNLTKNNTGLKLNFAFGYGSRNEIVSAVNAFIEKNPGEKISEKELAENLYSKEICDVDLLIRTGGDKRISNFLLWQIAYSELYFTRTPWPDFSVSEFQNILEKVESRERRFGQISEELSGLSVTEQMLTAIDNRSELQGKVKNIEL